MTFYPSFAVVDPVRALCPDPRSRCRDARGMMLAMPRLLALLTLVLLLVLPGAGEAKCCQAQLIFVDPAIAQALP